VNARASERLGIGVATTIAAMMLFFAIAALGQKVIRPDQIPCSEEIVRPNFELKERLRVSGQLKDPTGAPLADSKIILRTAGEKDKFVLYRVGSTNDEGHFDLGAVEAGRYRFLAAPNRGFRQPVKVACDQGRDCEISVVLQANPTDQPFAGCPIQ
jgi:hypothetical protein